MTHGVRTDTRTTYTDRRGGLRDSAARYALLPLRVFLGVTFIYAGLDKLTDSSFMKPRLRLARRHHARGPRLRGHPGPRRPGLKNPVGFGYVIALGELAVGIGTLLGLLGRLAALGGALISLSLWLTVSWASTPTTTATTSPI